MRCSGLIGAVMVVAVSATAGTATAQRDGAREVALEVARFVIDDAARRRVDEQITAGLMRTVSGTLQERLNRRLLDMEWRMLGDIVTRFVRDTLPPRRIEELAAEVYLRHFEEAELRELLTFQRSPVGRKLARLSPTVALDTMRAIDAELRASPAAREMLADLRRAFPVLGAVESP